MDVTDCRNMLANNPYRRQQPVTTPEMAEATRKALFLIRIGYELVSSVGGMHAR